MSFWSRTHTSLFRRINLSMWSLVHRVGILAKNVFLKYILNVCRRKHILFYWIISFKFSKKATYQLFSFRCPPGPKTCPQGPQRVQRPVQRRVLRVSLRESRVRFRDGGSSLTASSASVLLLTVKTMSHV